MIIDAEVYLEHYGVPGMKWGVRKTAGGSAKKGDSDIVLKKNTKIVNVSMNKARDVTGPIYGAHLQKDVLNYRGNYAYDLKAFKGADKVFSNAFTVKADMNVAGRKTQIEAFKKLWESDKETMAKALAESQKDMKFSAAFNARVLKLDRTDAYQKKMMSRGEKWVATKGTQEFNASLGTEGSKPVAKQYFKELEKRGYNAVLDLNDVKQYGSDEPILVFNPKKSVKKHSAVELTEKDVSRAADAYAFEKKREAYVDTLHS